MRNSSKPWLISIIGPTAVGKTALAIELAKWLKCEIISADSRQFYKEMTIGTAKPTTEELASVPHHFIDSHSIDEYYSAGEFGRDALSRIQELHKSNKVVITVGGSSLYLKALWEGFDEIPAVDMKIRDQLIKEFEDNGLENLLKELSQKDPNYYEKVDRRNHQRIIRALEVIRSSGTPFSEFRLQKNIEMPYDQLKIGLNIEREELFDRINERMDVMIKEGLFEEAESLFDYRNHNALQTVGYSEIFDFMEGKYDKEEAVRLLKRNSRRYAKRQLTWFRRFEEIHWFAPQQKDQIKQLIKETLL